MYDSSSPDKGSLAVVAAPVLPINKLCVKTLVISVDNSTLRTIDARFLVRALSWGKRDCSSRNRLPLMFIISVIYLVSTPSVFVVLHYRLKNGVSTVYFYDNLFILKTI